MIKIGRMNFPLDSVPLLFKPSAQINYETYNLGPAARQAS